jgi:iron-sulfur cluster assembly protein
MNARNWYGRLVSGHFWATWGQWRCPENLLNVHIKKSRQFVDSASFVNNVKAQISRGLKTNMDANIFQVTEKADQMIQQFFQEKKEKPVVRVFLSQGGWSGPSLGMALDEPKDDDEIVKNNGVTYLVNKQLLDQVKPITVDFVESGWGSGFSISSSLKKADGCGSGSCSC